MNFKEGKLYLNIADDYYIKDEREKLIANNTFICSKANEFITTFYNFETKKKICFLNTDSENILQKGLRYDEYYIFDKRQLLPLPSNFNLFMNKKFMIYNRNFLLFERHHYMSLIEMLGGKISSSHKNIDYMLIPVENTNGTNLEPCAITATNKKQNYLYMSELEFCELVFEEKLFESDESL